MWKKNWKKYGKIVAAAVFLTAAGLYYGFVGKKADAVRLDENGHVVAAESESFANLGVGVVDEAALGELAGLQGQNNVAETDSEGVYVHICGEVEKPGVYELEEGSRVFQAVEAAGGFTAEASQSSMNLAETIADGMQIVILSKEEAEAVQAAAEESAAGLVNINQASKEQLMALPGIGESRAEDIIRYREESGGFQRIEDIMKVSGIKDAAFQKIKDSIAV